MKIERTQIEGVFIIENFNALDDRGLFVKTFNSNSFKENNMDFEIRESYYSVSKKNVVRGMHFQLPPHDHEKIVYVPKGSILDVVLDLRKKSKTYKKFISVILSGENKKLIVIPKGIAHGFKSLSDGTITVYNVASEYHANFDKGIKFDSFGFNWGNEKFILSKRDKNFLKLESYLNTNPF